MGDEIVVHTSEETSLEFPVTIDEINVTEVTNVSDDGTLIQENVKDINFGNGLLVSDDGDGSITVDFSSTSTSTDTRTDLSDSSGVVVEEAEDITFTATGAASVQVASDGDGTGTVEINSTGTDTTDHSQLTNVQSDQHHTKYSDSDAISAINSDTDHGSTASHNYFSGDYNDLSNKPDLSSLNDTVIEPSKADFPSTGDNDKVYIAQDTGYMFRWNGSSYTQLTDQTAIWGEISGTLSDQTDLQNTLDAKLESVDETDLNFDTATQTELNNHINVTDAHHAKYTDENAQDAVGGIITGSGATTVTYDDSNNIIEVSSTDTDTRTDVSEAGTSIVTEVEDINFTDSGAASVTVSDDGDGTSTITVDATDTDTTDHSQLTNVQSDQHHTKTTSASDLTDVSADSVSDAHHAKYTDDDAQDAVGTIMSGSGATTVTYDDANNTITVDSTDNDTQTDVSDNGSTVVSSVGDINFSSNLSVSDDTDGTVTVDATSSYTEEVTLTSGGMTQWADGLSNEEVDRIVLQSGETLTIERIEVRQKGGGSNTNFSVRVQDVTVASTIGSQNLGGTTKDPGSSGTGNAVAVQLSNSTGGTVNASYKITARIEEA